MLPTLNVFGDYVVSDHIAPRTSDLHFGDVAVYKSPMNPARFVCKRIVGLVSPASVSYGPVNAIR
jgi:inner membrane protease subunit 1